MQTKSRVTLALRPVEPYVGHIPPVEIVACPECHLAVRAVEMAVTAPSEWKAQQGGATFGAVYIGECVCGATVVMAEDK